MWDPFSVGRSPVDQAPVVLSEHPAAGAVDVADDLVDDPAPGPSAATDVSTPPADQDASPPPVEEAAPPPQVPDDEPVAEVADVAGSTDDGVDCDLHVVQVNPLVWRRAMELADGDARRIEIIDPTRVTVHNKRVR